MPTTISTKARDKSTFVVTAAFKDAAGAAVSPSAVTWTLMDADGDVVNSRTAVSVAPGTSVDIVLSGEDLDYADGAVRVLLIEATYTSTEGADLPLKETVTFTIEDLLGVS